jgi:periplasmic copper chaperone A
MKKTIAVAALGAALALPAAAAAHVTVQPEQAPAGGFTRLDVRVPNERDDAGTTKVDVQMPPGFIFASYEPVPGWDVKVTKRKLDTPIEAHGEKHSEEVGRITWTGDGKTGIIRPGEFQDFGLSLGMPEEEGKKLTFKSLQTYENGEVVRWIGPSDADEPAPQVELTAAEGEDSAQSGSDSDTEQAADVQAAGVAADDDDGAPVWVAIVAVGLGAIGLLAGVAGLMASRRRAG